MSDPSESHAFSDTSKANTKTALENEELVGYDIFVHDKGVTNIDEELICHMKQGTARIVFGVVLVLLIAISWVGATQFANSTYTPNFSAPYFTTWYTTCFMVVVFPLFSVPQLFKKKPFRFKTFFRESAIIFGPRGVCLISLVKYILPFCIIWLASNYLYIRALSALNPADVTALFSSVSAFVYILSMIFLKENFFITRLTAVLMSIGGIVLFASRYGFKGPTTTGVILTVLAAAASAIYQVMFKRFLGFATSSQVALFLTFVGLCNMLVFWVIIIPLHYTGFETIVFPDMPWGPLNGSGVLVLIFNYLLNFGIAYTSPLFIALGTMLGTPLNAITDFLFRGTPFGVYKTVAAILILTGFLLMLIPNDTLRRFENKLMCTKEVQSPSEANENDVDGMIART